MTHRGIEFLDEREAGVDIHIEKNVQVRMRDGVTLAADVIRPAGEGRHPALVQRLPYNKERDWLRDNSIDVFRIVQAGYAVVHQDTRGCGASEGVFRPFLDERPDGADTVEWAAAQSWSSGVVGMVGISYHGETQWLAAMEQPPALKAFAPHSCHHDPYHGLLYQGGAFSLGFAVRWALNSGLPGVKDKLGEYLASEYSFKDVVRRLPITDMPMLKDVARFYFEWLEHPEYDEYWHPWSPMQHYDRVMAPPLITTGWYDIFLGSSIDSYRGMKERGGNEAARRPQLIIGPWSHGWWGSDFPERGYGERADKEAFNLTGITARWFDYHLKGIDNGVAHDKPVHIFLMGPNVWLDEDDWPLPGTMFTRYYLHGGGRANTPRGDGALSTEPPGNEREDVYLYNPHDPVPTLGGAHLLPPVRMPANAGPRDQRPLDARADVLCFVSEPLMRDTEMTGPVELVMFVSSSAVDTDFTAKLIDVHPDGRAEIVTDGILRARYRESFSVPSLLKPGQIYEIRINMAGVGNVFPADHRIRLDVSSSNFPRFDRNSNTGHVIATDGDQDVQVAVNRVYHDRDHPSHLILPMIERA
jgi:uncharacterized protein